MYYFIDITDCRGVFDLNIEYKTKKLERICGDYEYAKGVHGVNMAKLIHQRKSEITAAESIDLLVQFRIGRCHALQGDRKGEFALDLEQPYRLIIRKGDSESTCVIKSIEDYH